MIQPEFSGGSGTLRRDLSSGRGLADSYREHGKHRQMQQCGPAFIEPPPAVMHRCAGP